MRRAFLFVFLAIWLFIGGRVLLNALDPAADTQTSLSCSDCETLSVMRIIDGDTFDSDRGRVRLYGMGHARTR